MRVVSKMLPAVFLAIFFTSCSLSLAQEASHDETTLAALQAVSSSNLNLTSSIYKVLSKSEGNVLFSPTSIQTILGLTYLGARGETARQMARGLHLPEDNQLVTRGFHALITSLQSGENMTLEIANKIYTDLTVPLKKEFEDIATKSFVSGVEAVDFRANHEAARVHINQWVEEKTHDKIKELLEAGIITPDTIFVLVNALYFKGVWKQKFDRHSARPEPFFLTPTKSKNVSTMYIKSDKFGYLANEELGCQVLEMPFQGDRVSMFVLLPNQLDGLANLEASLPEVNLHQLLDNAVKTEVRIHLPKFKIEQTTDLNDVLKKLGMVNMFDSADFSGMTDVPVKVSKVVHKAFIDVNEEGAEGAAATGIVIVKKIGRSTPTPEFKADHPFLFILREKSTNALLFVGRVSSP